MASQAYILFCAGEDSGDILGEEAVIAVRASGYEAKGAGGQRMVSAGMLSLVPFEDLPVSGFGDVFPRYFRFREYYKILRTALADPLCKAFVAIDYPGLNRRLMGEADRFSKPVFYIAPPQIWAWKTDRGSQFAGRRVAVLFELERAVYERFGALATRLRHPFLNAVSGMFSERLSEVLLLPGSRLGQMRRNAPLYKKIAESLQRKYRWTPVLLASRPALVPILEALFDHQYEVRLSPQDESLRARYFANSQMVISVPGTATVEAVLAGTPVIACARIDSLTYLIGKRYLKTRYLAMPNVLLDQSLIPEIIVPAFASVPKTVKRVISQIQLLSAPSFATAAKELREKLDGTNIGNWIRKQVESIGHL